MDEASEYVDLLRYPLVMRRLVPLVMFVEAMLLALLSVLLLLLNVLLLLLLCWNCGEGEADLPVSVDEVGEYCCCFCFCCLC